MDDLYHELLGLQRVDHVLTKSFLFYGLDEVVGDFIVDVGIHQGLADILQGFGYVDFGNSAFAFENLERAFEALG